MAARLIVFSDDTLFAEAGLAYVTKKTFRIVSDSNAPVQQWRAIISLRNTGVPGNVSCRVQIGADTSATMTTNSAGEAILNATFNKTTANNVLLTVNFQIKADAVGTVAQIQYTDLYAIIS